MNAQATLHEPHKIKTVRLLSFPTPEMRKKHLAESRFNVFHLTPSQVSFDMCSNGINAMSQEQFSGQCIGDEAYAGSRNFEALERAVQDVLGHHYVCPTHNILGGVTLVVATMLSRGTSLPSNVGYATYFRYGFCVPLAMPEGCCPSLGGADGSEYWV